MSQYYTKKDKCEYERLRRFRVMDQSRNYRLMEAWLGKQHPNTLTAYLDFKDELRRQNPNRLDLTTSPMFQRFMLEENDTAQTPSKEETAQATLEKSEKECAKWKTIALSKRPTLQRSMSEGSQQGPNNPLTFTDTEVEEVLKDLEETFTNIMLEKNDTTQIPSEEKAEWYGVPRSARAPSKRHQPTNVSSGDEKKRRTVNDE